MSIPFSTALDTLTFIGLAWIVWRLLGRSIPIAATPTIISLLFAATGVLSSSWGVPSKLGDQIGFLGVLLLAFTAGLETRQSAHLPNAPNAGPLSRAQALRIIASAEGRHVDGLARDRSVHRGQRAAGTDRHHPRVKPLHGGIACRLHRVRR